MVASGVPVPNGKQHAMEVAMMSLDLLAKILTFEIQVVLCILIDASVCPQKSDLQNAAGAMVIERVAGTIPVTGISNGMAGGADFNQVALPSVLPVFSFEFLGGTNTRSDCNGWHPFKRTWTLDKPLSGIFGTLFTKTMKDQALPCHVNWKI